jgi:hypothetical protein
LAAGVAFYVADLTIVQQELDDLRGLLPADAVSLMSGWLQHLAQRPRA